MPTVSKIEAELSKVLKIKQGKRELQDFLKAIVEAGADLSDAEWDDLSGPAQKWLNAATKQFQAKKTISDFPDADRGDDEGDDEKEERRERPSSRRSDRSAKEEDDEAEAEAEGDGDEGDGESDEKEERSSRRGSRDKDEDKPSRRGGSRNRDDDKEERSSRRGSSRDKDDDKEERSSRSSRDKKDDKKKDDKGSSRGGSRTERLPPKKTEAEPKGVGVKDRIKDVLRANPSASVDDICKKVDKKGQAPISRVTVANIRAEWRHTIKNFQNAGELKKLEL